MSQTDLVFLDESMACNIPVNFNACNHSITVDSKYNIINGSFIGFLGLWCKSYCDDYDDMTGEVIESVNGTFIVLIFEMPANLFT